MSHPLLCFVQSLWAGGDLVLSNNVAPDDADVALSMSELQVLETGYRGGLPGHPPQLHIPAAAWALNQLYRASQYLVYRELSEEQMQVDLNQPYTEAITSSVCYSVDLSFRFLPELMRLAQASSANQTLVEILRGWAAAWPLSSVGIPGVKVSTIDPIPTSACLLTLYVDRVLASGDQSRLQDEQVANAVRIALGGFRDLCPAIYDAVHEVQ
ncbi:MAG: hypothetical protein V4719_03590 [Planctomycetota bacterium]